MSFECIWRELQVRILVKYVEKCNHETGMNEDEEEKFIIKENRQQDSICKIKCELLLFETYWYLIKNESGSCLK